MNKQANNNQPINFSHHPICVDLDGTLWAGDCLWVCIGKFLKKGNINFLDCGCGFGYIARELIKTTNLKIYYCDPSKSIKKIHDKIFPKENFFCSDIQNLFRFKRK
jgi:SAM-dependent methyltransferase